jgi:hypothetical protein
MDPVRLLLLLVSCFHFFRRLKLINIGPNFTHDNRRSSTLSDSREMSGSPSLQELSLADREVARQRKQHRRHSKVQIRKERSPSNSYSSHSHRNSGQDFGLAIAFPPTAGSELTASPSLYPVEPSLVGSFAAYSEQQSQLASNHSYPHSLDGFSG